MMFPLVVSKVITSVLSSYVNSTEIKLLD
ncbi:hypothetical protein [Escherichia phage BF17]|nr:hypothetical protein [Escherichia phage BF17]QXN76637.1 hypothetical protein [Escherichia phage BF17]